MARWCLLAVTCAVSIDGDNTRSQIKLARHALGLVQFFAKISDVFVNHFDFRKLRKDARYPLLKAVFHFGQLLDTLLQADALILLAGRLSR